MKKKIKLAINGFGRIGRIAARIVLEKDNIDLVAINSRADAYSHAHLLKYDSVYGIFDKSIEADSSHLIVGNKIIEVYREENPSNIPWKKTAVDIVLEATGVFKTKKECQKHIKAGAKMVIVTAPAKDELKTFCFGVNHLSFDPKEDIVVSNASCTTNCLAIVAKVLDESFAIISGFMTTVHSYTDSQNLMDNSHKKNLRLARAAVLNIIPSTTGASSALALVLPNLKGKINSLSLRVPTPTVSLIDLMVKVAKKTNVEQINSAFSNASKKTLSGILDITFKPLVSSDVKGSSLSALVDGCLTQVKDDLVNVKAWYDNEWGYTSRVIDLVDFIGPKVHF